RWLRSHRRWDSRSTDAWRQGSVAHAAVAACIPLTTGAGFSAVRRPGPHGTAAAGRTPAARHQTMPRSMHQCRCGERPAHDVVDRFAAVLAGLVVAAAVELARPVGVALEFAGHVVAARDDLAGIGRAGKRVE